jgi:hypothetical protein
MAPCNLAEVHRRFGRISCHRIQGRRERQATNKHMKSTMFWAVTPHSLLEVHQRFKGTYYLHLQGRKYANQATSKNQAFEEYYLLRCDVVHFSRSSLTFRRHILLPSSGSMSMPSNRWTRRKHAKSTIFWNVTQCIPLVVYRRFGVTLPPSSGLKTC